jgi:hypothetical protein
MNSQSKTSLSNSANPNPDSETIDFIEQVRVNQEKLAKELKPPLRLHRLRVRFFRLGGRAPAGSESAVSVLLLKAGGSDDVPTVMEANQ